MITFCRPTDVSIRAHLHDARDAPFTYDDVGCTRQGQRVLPRGWNRDQERVLLGHGREVFERASLAIKQWRMFPVSVATLCWRDCPLEVGRTVAVLYRAKPMLCWMVFPARIAYVIDDGGQNASGSGVRQFGFAYGTIADHPEIGEERFLVEWNPATDEVWYDLLAISQPGHLLARLGYPYTRFEQARFRRLSCAAMLAAVQSHDAPAEVPAGPRR